MSDATSVKEVTFEDGYGELKRIVKRLDADDVSVHETCELFATGKGYEKHLRAYLETQQGKLDEIEAGENLPEFRIVAPSEPSSDVDRGETVEEPDADDTVPDSGDFQPPGSGDFQPTPPPANGSDDDIPF